MALACDIDIGRIREEFSFFCYFNHRGTPYYSEK